MSYIGIKPAESFTSFATQTFSTSATSSYTLDHAVTNENELALFINNVRQQPGSGNAYTATGTTLTLSANTASTDTMYAVFLGRALQTVNPPAASVGATQLADTLISGKTALAATPADTDELLISDAGTLKRIDYSHIKTTTGFTKLLSTTTADASSSAITFDSTYITTTYDLYFVSGWCIPADDGGDLRIRVQSSGSDDTTSSGYGYENVNMGGDNHNSTNAGSYIRIKDSGTFGGTNAGEGWLLNCWVSNPLSSSYPTMITGTANVVQQDGNHEGTVFSGCRYYSANNGLTFYWGSGNHDTGSTLTLYGVTK